MARSYKRKKTKGLTGRGRLAIVFASLVVLSGLYFAFQDQIKNAIANSNSGESIKIGVVTWPGYAAGQYMNDGFEANTECRFYEEYGIQVEFMVLDDFVASRKAFENGDVDLLWVTVDALPTEMGQNGTMVMGSPKFIFQADWSRGGDAVVARRGIDKVSDLKGKTVAVAQGTPSHSFLIELLKTNSMTMDDIKVQFVADAIRAAELFKQAAEIARITNEVDAEKRTITENLLDDMKLEDYARQKSLTAIQTYLTKVSKANSGFEEENIRVQRWKEKQLDNLSKDPILRFKEMQEINAREKERLKEISDSQQKVWGELQGQLRDTGVEYDKYIQVFGQLEKLERESRSDLRFTIDYYSTYENVVNELQLKVVELANAKGEESGETNKNTKTINKNTKAVDANTEAKKINKEFSLFSDRKNKSRPTIRTQ